MGPEGPKGNQVTDIRIAYIVQVCMKNMTHRVTAQGDQGETGDIGVKGDQVRYFNATFPSKFTMP